MTSSQLPSPDQPRRSRILHAQLAVNYAFLVCGLGTGIWATHIPLIQARLQIDPAILGIAIFTMALASLITMPLVGVAIGKFGSRPPTAFMMFAFICFMPLPLLADSVPLFFAAVFLFGTTIGALDVSMNVQATEVEAARGRPTMSSFHGFYSAGALVGAGLGAAIIAAGLGDGRGASLAAVFFLALAIVAAFNLWSSARSTHAGPHFALPNRAAFALGMIAFLAFAIEGSVTDWSALFLATVKQAGVAQAGAGFAGFSIAMAVFRLSGDVVVARLGAKTTMVGGSAVIIAGQILAILAPWPVLSAAGFALIGIGAANLVPVVFSAASRVPGMPPNLGVAAVTTMGYAGFLSVPPILGFVGHAFGLTVMLALVALMGVMVLALSSVTYRSR
jgi:MFS family permease